MKLYEIAAELERWFWTHEDWKEAGATDAAWDELAALQMAFNDKLGGIGRLLKNLEAESDAIKAEATKLTERRWALQTRIDGLKNYVTRILDGQRWSDSAIAFSFRRSEAVKVDENKLQPKWYREKLVREVDKEAIKIALKNGQQIAGAELEERLNLQVK